MVTLHCAFWKPMRDYWREQNPQTEAALRQALTLETIRWQYLYSVRSASHQAMRLCPGVTLHGRRLVSGCCTPGAQRAARDLGTMATVNPVVDATPAAADPVDPESAEWLGALAGRGAQREAALARLHAMLLRVARRECRRRGPRLRVTGPELEDLAYQAAADALVAITRKLGQFRGESRFTTWAYRFVIFEVSDKIGRHFLQHPGVPLDAGDWDRLPDRFGFEPAREAEWRDLLAALRRAVDTELSPRQRQVFVALVVNAVPLDALVIELGSNRGAIYKVMFDARRKLRAALAANGYMSHDVTGRS